MQGPPSAILSVRNPGDESLSEFHLAETHALTSPEWQGLYLKRRSLNNLGAYAGITFNIYLGPRRLRYIIVLPMTLGGPVPRVPLNLLANADHVSTSNGLSVDVGGWCLMVYSGIKSFASLDLAARWAASLVRILPLCCTP